jgi:hypothetical protein
MKKGLNCLAGIIVACNLVNAQADFSIKPGTPLFMGSGTSLGIDGLGLKASSNTVITGITSITRNTRVSHTTPNLFISRVYDLNGTLNGFNGDISIAYQENEINDLVESTFTLNIYDGTAWSAYSNNVIRDEVNDSITTKALANINANELILVGKRPVYWANINAVRNSSSVNIAWSTTEEYSIVYFDVERSVDGTTWQTVVANVPPANMVGNNQYTKTDPSSLPEQTYYRIKEVDTKGRVNYSSTAKVNALTTSVGDVEDSAGIVFYPNPTNNVVIIHPDNPYIRIQSVNIYDINGKLVFNQKQSGSTDAQINLAYLPAGVYMLQATLSDKSVIKKRLIKQ